MKTIMFLPLNRSEIQQIVGIQLKNGENMEEQNGIKIEISQKAWNGSRTGLRPGLWRVAP